MKTFYYLRLHGRNAAQWWKHDKSEDRYNYLYSAEELEPFAEAAATRQREVKKAYLYANNHFSAKSVANAAILKDQARTGTARRIPAGVHRALPGSEGPGEAASGPLLLHVSLLEDVGLLNLRDDVHPAYHRAEDGVLAIQLRCHAQVM